jgi:type I restriction enzyme R subunit
MKLHKEVSFEDEICAHLSANGWLYDHSDASSYDRARALFTADLLAWVKATHPKSWEAFAKNHGNSAEGVLLDRVRKQLDDRGTLVPSALLKQRTRNPTSSSSWPTISAMPPDGAAGPLAP